MITNQEKGDNYESFVEGIYSAILKAQEINGRVHPINLEKKKTIIGRSESSNEFDIYWEYELAGITYRTAIECKYRGSGNVEVKEIRDFSAKLTDCHISKGICASNSVFQDSCKKVAEHDGIELMVLRKPEDKDWEGRIKEINVILDLIIPARTTKILPIVDVEWAKRQGYTEGTSLQFQARNDQVIFEDRATDFRSSISDLEEARFDNPNDGAGQWKKEFSDGWMLTPDDEYKLQGVVIEYVNPPSMEEKFNIDFGSTVLAIQEIINQTSGGVKSAVLDTGHVKPFS